MVRDAQLPLFSRIPSFVARSAVFAAKNLTSKLAVRIVENLLEYVNSNFMTG